MTRFALHQGDSREVLKTLAENSVDSIVCDPPYHLTNKGGGPHNKTPNAYSRAQAGAGATGFMGMTWDGGDVANRPEVWAECLRVAKPGAWLLAFGGTRTFHRMACAIEDAGFEIRDQIGWAFGSGFPKSHNGEWGGTALKPAWEPICMARKPLIGTVEANWREHGTGALNIDGCRIGFAGDADQAAAFPGGKVTSHGSGSLAGPGAAQEVDRTEFAAERNTTGRWPANLIHDGSDEVVALFPREAGAFAPVRGNEPSSKTTGIYGGGLTRKVPQPFHADTGSAARFFYCAKASREDRNEGAENNHPTVKPTDLMAYLCRLVTPPGGLVLDPFMGSGSTGKAAMLEGFRFVGIDLSAEYIAIARARIDFALRQGHQPSLLEAA